MQLHIFTVRPPCISEVPSHLANVLCYVYLKTSIDFVWETICLRILVPGIEIEGMWPHSIVGSHNKVDSTEMIYQLVRNLWRCDLQISGGG